QPSRSMALLALLGLAFFYPVKPPLEVTITKPQLPCPEHIGRNTSDCSPAELSAFQCALRVEVTDVEPLHSIAGVIYRVVVPHTEKAEVSSLSGIEKNINSNTTFFVPVHYTIVVWKPHNHSFGCIVSAERTEVRLLHRRGITQDIIKGGEAAGLAR